LFYSSLVTLLTTLVVTDAAYIISSYGHKLAQSDRWSRDLALGSSGYKYANAPRESGEVLTHPAYTYPYAEGGHAFGGHASAAHVPYDPPRV